VEVIRVSPALSDNAGKARTVLAGGVFIRYLSASSTLGIATVWPLSERLWRNCSTGERRGRHESWRNEQERLFRGETVAMPTPSQEGVECQECRIRERSTRTRTCTHARASRAKHFGGEVPLQWVDEASKSKFKSKSMPDEPLGIRPMKHLGLGRWTIRNEADEASTPLEKERERD